ncbi:HvfC family RiPP maturation protein [Wenzhouxiangella marina]|uniref:Uncharacterized protein n=1 Tax=Wenzhouxiangella marina TaxID=1579979 RepID=A0A0K0XVF1_9GAMM|nr:putative DNA-binding domain-containing protein [Wenzhouxiangella marina]AKS41658.1 hypothetical protein WM2015_1285 [Wenzhouxiangella marina]MBB6086581.1 hypothetical protein [Wenzhouxiangella marina]
MSKQPPERLLELQRRFAAHLRDPEHAPAPEGIEERRLAIYRRLFFNNLSNLFARNFPVIRRLHEDADWQALIREFLAEHRSHTPMFTEIGREFVDFLERRGESDPEQAPWLAELAHWEFLETCVRLDEAEVAPDGWLESLEADDRVQVNPTLCLAEYRWPVHRIGPEFRPEQGEATLLAVYRQGNDRVAFMQVNPITARLLQLLRGDEQATAARALERLAEELERPVDELLEASRDLLATLARRGLLRRA